MKRLLWILFPAICSAQEISFDVQPREIGINEAVQFVVRIENGTRSSTPEFPASFEEGDFSLLSSAGNSSSQTSIINGVITSTQSYSYSFQPRKKGVLRFPSQTVVIGGKRYRSPEFKVTVGDEVRNIGRSGFSDPFGRRRRGPEAEVFARMEVPKTEYYLGEVIPLTVKIFQTPGVRIQGQGSSINLPEFRDFWVEEVEGQVPEFTVIQEGKRYEVLTIERRRLYANKTGPIQIEPTRFSLVVAAELSFFSDFQRVERQTNSLDLTIKPLPAQGKPADFTGIVGNFKVEGSLDTDRVKVGESVSLQVKVTGEGNFSALQDLKPDGLSGAFEIFEGGTPAVEKRLGVPVSKTWAFALVPKREGSYRIPLPRFTYFDLASESYKATEQMDFPLEVLPGQGLAQSGPIQPEDRRLFAEQSLSFIKLGKLGALNATPNFFHPRILTQVAAGFLALDAVVFLGLFWWSRRLSRMVALRPKYAYSNFRRAVGRLRGKSKDSALFYASLSAAVLNYFGDKYERPGQGISLDFIREKFHRCQMDGGLYEKVVEIIEACDLARFTPSTPSSRDNLLQKTSAIIKEVEGAMP